MKRVRIKRVRITTSPPRNLPPAVAATMASGTIELWDWERWDAAVDCMMSIRRTLDHGRYHEFLDTLSRVHSIGARALVDRVKVLLRGHPDLKRQFNMFVPAEYILSLSDDDQQ